MPRTTLNLDSSVLDELRRRATVEHKSLGEVASKLLSKQLANGSDQEPRPLRWISRHLGTPRVDLEDKEALNALLDQT